MLDIQSFLGGNFFSQRDLAQPAQVLTIAKVEPKVVGQGKQAETKICLTFAESPKPLVMNKTNLSRVAELYGEAPQDVVSWRGRQLLVYRSMTTFSGQAMLCVRCCGPSQAPPDPICDAQSNVVPYSQAIGQPPQQAAPPQQQQPATPRPAAAPPQPAQPPAASPWTGQQPVAPPQPPSQENSPPSE